MKHIFGFSSGGISFSIEKGQMYHIVKNGVTMARFDTEEKARMYADALDKGIEWGYSAGYQLGCKTREEKNAEMS